MGSLRLLLLEEIIMCLTGKRICMAHSAAQWKEKLSDKNDGEMKKNLSHLSQENKRCFLSMSVKTNQVSIPSWFEPRSGKCL